LVEDDADIRTVVSIMMTFWGEQPLAFPDGFTAWAWLDSVENGAFTGELPDLALMDIRMPGYRGDQLAARIRQVEALRHIPIVLMTAFSLTSDEKRDIIDRGGIDHLIHKPLDMEELRTTLYQARDERRNRLAHPGQNGDNG
jgi:CheY-like chemotaxis protein